MIQNYFNNVKRILGSLISNARAREGWGKGIYLFSFLKIGGSPAKRAMRAGKKKRGSGGNEFLPARPVWGGKRFRLSSLEEGQNRKIFVSLIEKIFGGAQLKNVKKIFLFCSPKRSGGGRKRWAGFLPVRAEILVQKRFALRSAIATNLNIANFAGSLFARSPRLRRGFARIFPYISAQNQTDGQNQKSVFCPAGGGSGRQSRQSKNTPLRNLLNCFCFPIFSACRFAALRSQFFNPALFPPKAEMDKGDY